MPQLPVQPMSGFGPCSVMLLPRNRTFAAGSAPIRPADWLSPAARDQGTAPNARKMAQQIEMAFFMNEFLLNPANHGAFAITLGNLPRRLPQRLNIRAIQKIEAGEINILITTASRNSAGNRLRLEQA